MYAILRDVSQANVDLVRSLQPPPGTDLRQTFFHDDEEAAAAAIEAAGAVFTEDFVCVFHGLSAEERPGIEGLRQSWLDWLGPWESYRVEIEDVRDVGERVLVFSRDFGKRPGLDSEVELKGSAVWTVIDGRVARAEFFALRRDALQAVGLDEPA